MERPPNVSDVCATPSLEVARCAAVLPLRKMADRIQARAIRRCGELLKQVEAGKNRFDDRRDGTDMPINRKEAARDAGLSERQKVTALRVANVPEPEFHQAVESETPPTITQLAEVVWRPARSRALLPPIASSNPTQLPTSFLPTFIAATSIKANRQWPWRWPFQIPNRGSDKPL